jgi:hypothetical protein
MDKLGVISGEDVHLIDIRFKPILLKQGKVDINLA